MKKIKKGQVLLGLFFDALDDGAEDELVTEDERLDKMRKSYEKIYEMHVDENKSSDTKESVEKEKNYFQASLYQTNLLAS